MTAVGTGGVGEELMVSEQGEWVTGPEMDPGRAPVLPDLARIDLRTLRAMDDPGLDAAVERVLGHSRELSESWCGGNGEENPFDRMFPAVSGRSRGGERAG
ncbi:hypothetical protein ACWFRJ_18955 [Streptomyces sp. NPDC055239]